MERYFQMKLTDTESRLINSLRDIQRNGGEPLGPEQVSILQQTLVVLAYAGDRFLGRFSVDASNSVMECALVGSELHNKLLIDEVDYTAKEDAFDDEDSVLGTPPQAADDHDVDVEPVSWEEIKKEVIPPYVKGFTFSVAEEDMTAEHRKELTERFLGVNIQVDVQSSGPNLKRKQGHSPDVSMNCERPPLSPSPIVSSEATSHGPVADDPEHIPDRANERTSQPSGPLLELKPEGSNETIDATVNGIAKQIGLQIKRPQIISDMYGEWFKTKKIRPFAPRYMNLQTYYEHLVNFYIIAHNRRLAELEYAILLKFQGTNFKFTNDLPEVPIAVKSFQFLPIRSPLCRWITILYSFLWDSVKAGDYANFRKLFEELDNEALTKLLYCVAQIRCPFTLGHDAAVLQRWCEVHAHIPGSNKEELCTKMKKDNNVCVEDAVRAEEHRILKDAEDTVRKFGGSVTTATPNSILPNAFGSKTGKRKSENVRDAPSAKRRKSDKRRGSHPFSATLQPDVSDKYAPSARTKALYDHWVQKGSLPVHRPPIHLPAQQLTANPAVWLSASDQTYDDLLDLMIYASHEDLANGFEMVVFKKWQETDFSMSSDYHLADLRLVDKAFKDLPPHHFLLKHLARCFACVWGTQSGVLMDDYEPRGEAFERFLYGVCWARSVFRNKLEDTMAWRWCEFHRHETFEEERKCIRWRDSIIKSRSWEDNWEKRNKEQMELNMTLKDLSKHSFEQAQDGRPTTIGTRVRTGVQEARRPKQSDSTTSARQGSKFTPAPQTTGDTPMESQSSKPPDPRTEKTVRKTIEVIELSDLSDEGDELSNAELGSLYVLPRTTRARKPSTAASGSAMEHNRDRKPDAADANHPFDMQVNKEDEVQSFADPLAMEQKINIGRGSLRSAKTRTKAVSQSSCPSSEAV